MDFTTNYCGPYWSDGRFQPSVASGKAAVSELDRACQMHDRDYALARNQEDLVVADDKFYHRTKHLGIRGPLYGSLVKYGNQYARDSMAFFAPFFSLVGLSAASTAAIATTIPKKKLRGTVNPEIIQGEMADQVCYEPEILSDPPPSWNTSPQENYNAVHIGTASMPLYKPLKQKKNRNFRNKNTVKPVEGNSNSRHKTHKNSNKTKSPENKIISETLKYLSRKVGDDRKENSKTNKHVDQEKCSHPDIRACYNYKYCTRCDREFH